MIGKNQNCLLPKSKKYCIITADERLGAPLTQAFITLTGSKHGNSVRYSPNFVLHLAYSRRFRPSKDYLEDNYAG
jgi:hypothetical protein